MPYLGIFGLEFLKSIITFESSIVEFDKNNFFNSCSEFCIGSAFSKVLGFTFWRSGSKSMSSSNIKMHISREPEMTNARETNELISNFFTNKDFHLWVLWTFKYEVQYDLTLQSPHSLHKPPQ